MPLIAIESAIAQNAPAQAPAGSDAASQQFAFAYRLLQRKEDKLAAEAFDEFLGKFPTDARRGDALYYRGVLAQRGGNLQAAANFLKDAPAPTLISPYAMALLKGQLSHDLGKFPDAIAVLEKIEIDKLDAPLKASTHYLLGLCYRGAGNNAAAQKSLAAAAEIDSPVRAMSLLESARLLVQLDKLADAIEMFAKAVAVGDSNVTPEAARSGGDLCYKLENYARAIDFYKVVIASHQSSVHYGASVLGTMWSQAATNGHEAVVKTFENLKDSLPAEDKPMAFYLAGTSLQEMNKHEPAIAVFSQMPPGVKDAPYDKATFKIAASHFELAQYDAMNKALEELKKRYPESTLNADGEFLLAAADSRRGEPAQAAARLTEIIKQGEKHPYLAQAYFHRARISDTGKQYEPAAVDYVQVVELGRKGLVSKQNRSIVTDAALRLMALLTVLNKDDQIPGYADWLLTQNPEALAEQEALYRKAAALIKTSKLDPALETLNVLFKKHAKNVYEAEAHYYRGLLLMSLQKPDEAVTELLASAAYPPGAANAQAGSFITDAQRINALRVSGIRLRERNDEKNAAETLLTLEKNATLAGLTPDELIWLARYFFGQRKPAESLKYASPLVDDNSAIARKATGAARAEAMLYAARSQRDLKQTPQAIDLFRRVIAFGQGFELRSRLELAKTLRDSGKTDEALAEYTGLVYAQSSAIACEAIYDAAVIQRGLGDARKLASDPNGAKAAYEESYKLYKRIIVLFTHPQLSPMPELAYIEGAEVAIELGQRPDAEKTWAELAEKFPDAPYASYAKAMLAISRNKRGDASFLLKKLRDMTTLDERLAQRVAREFKALEGTP